MARYTLYPPNFSTIRGVARPPVAFDYRERADLLNEEMEALNSRIDQAQKELAWLQRQLVEKRLELMEIAGISRRRK